MPAQPTSVPRSPDKLIDRMDRLVDMAHFPVLVNAGATVNILATVSLTWWVEAWLFRRASASYNTLTFAAPLLWTALVLVLNLAPVVALRAIHYNSAPIPRLRDMNFFRDQHRFSDWVYLAASANMAFWVLVSWAAFSLFPTPAALAVMLVAAFLVTFSPVLLRPLTQRAT